MTFTPVVPKQLTLAPVIVGPWSAQAIADRKVTSEWHRQNRRLALGNFLPSDRIIETAQTDCTNLTIIEGRYRLDAAPPVTSDEVTARFFTVHGGRVLHFAGGRFSLQAYKR